MCIEGQARSTIPRNRCSLANNPSSVSDTGNVSGSEALGIPAAALAVRSTCPFRGAALLKRQYSATVAVAFQIFQSPRAFLTAAVPRSAICRTPAVAVRFGWLDKFFYTGLSRFTSSFRCRSFRRARRLMADGGQSHWLGGGGGSPALPRSPGGCCGWLA